MSASLSHYFDVAPVRRRLRAALIVCFLGTLAVLWGPGIGKAWTSWSNLRSQTPYTQTGLDAALKKCLATRASGYVSPWGDWGQYLPVGEPGSCHRGNAATLNEERSASAYSNIRRALAKPLTSGMIALIVTCAIWIVIPLAERQPAKPSP
jgi:hypothetical protein